MTSFSLFLIPLLLTINSYATLGQTSEGRPARVHDQESKNCRFCPAPMPLGQLQETTRNTLVRAEDLLTQPIQANINKNPKDAPYGVITGDSDSQSFIPLTQVEQTSAVGPWLNPNSAAQARGNPNLDLLKNASHLQLGIPQAQN